ncbi:hypothetical protein KP509_31G049600 [Ceratopteris richardii]|uniref:Complex 1 LYR protein domain-containing protein n=1 Tax=Ceratopteris richardii TaxID=49495 RepID=A0A8T2QY36_CERRI|nr:hypothetical protein KP509_31G049600 [Ceratopteris richardii]KAH7288916.1 hypothetical protein KP509_31G049600 [Ceratopteris richardii]
MTVASASVAEVKALYRAFLREASKFPNYNIREYVKRRSRQGFLQNQNIAPELATAIFSEGKQLLEVAKRQTVVYSLYAPEVKNVMELKHVGEQ